MASSSSSHQQSADFGSFSESETKKFPVAKKLYDAFINHRGPDVKKNVAEALYKSLNKKKCQAFLDDQEFKPGDPLISTIENAIGSSRVQIAIFSPRYAESSWCLDELVLMLATKARFIPVFCDVNPNDLRYLENGVYAEGFKKQKTRGFTEERLDQWKKALETSAGFSGHILKTSEDKFASDLDMLCTNITLAVQKEVEETRYLQVAKYPTGLDELVEDFERQVGSQGNMVGILAMGGAGKTTLAKELYNRKRSNYARSSFVFDVREAYAKDQMTRLQSQLLKDLFDEDHNVRNVDEAIPILKDLITRDEKSFLIVLDNVDGPKQLDHLLFTKNRSLVIVTSRDEKVLSSAGIRNIYRLKNMEADYGKELFCWNAFGVPKAPPAYEPFVDSFVDLCGGLPLSIEVAAGNLNGENDVATWHEELKKFRSALPFDITRVLKISFDRLDREQKQIFMDIACFFIGELKGTGLRIWKASGWDNGEHTIRTLKGKCLLELDWVSSTTFQFDDPFVFKMHDHLRDLGREMADQQSSPRRRWRLGDIKSLETQGLRSIFEKPIDKNIRCFSEIFDSSLDSNIRYFLGNPDDHEQTSTDLLWIQIFWSGQKERMNIPSWIPLQRLQCMIINGRFWNPWQKDGQVPSQLKALWLRLRHFEFPEHKNELAMVSNLEDLQLEGWDELPVRPKFHVSWTTLYEWLGQQRNLRRLVLRNLTVVGEITLSMHNLSSVEISRVDGVSKVIIKAPSLEKLVLNFMAHLKQVRVESGKPREVIILDCPLLEELPVLTVPSFIQVKDSLKLEPPNVNEDLEEIEYLHLSNGQYSSVQYTTNRGLKPKSLVSTLSNEGIWNLLQRLECLPSKATTLIGRAVDGAESFLNEDLFSGITTSVDAVTELPRKGNGDSELPVEMTHPLSAIIVTLLIETSSAAQTSAEKQNVVIRFGPVNEFNASPEYICSRLEPGEWIVTIVMAGPKNLAYARMFIACPSLFVSGCRTKKICALELKEGERENVLSIVKKIVSELYKESTKSA